MRRVLVVSVATLFFLASCSEDQDRTIDATTTVAPVDEAAVTTQPEAVATDPPATAAPVTDAPASSPLATEPVATPPPATPPPSAAAPTTTPPAGPLTPVFMSFSVSEVSACPAPDVSVPLAPREVTITWEVLGTESVYVAVDNVDGPYETGLPPAGSITLGHNCPDGNTYYVVAENPEGRTVMEASR